MAETATTDQATETEEATEAQAAQPGANVEVSEAELPQAAERNVRGGGGQIDILLDASVSVAVHLGQTDVLVRDLLQMGAGSVVKLDKRVGEPVDLFLRGVKFAAGRMVVVGDQLAVRVEEILSSAEDDEGREDKT